MVFKVLLEKKYLYLDEYLFEKVFPLFIWKLFFRLTGRCGSHLQGDTGALHPDRRWLWKSEELCIGHHRATKSTCRSCGDTFVTRVSTAPLDMRPEAMKEESVRYAKDTLQPFRQGEPSREFIEAYPEQSKKLFTKEEIKKAKNVWTDVKGLS